MVAMDPAGPSESIYNLIPSDWKEPPQPRRYVGKQRLSLETRMENCSISGLSKHPMTFKTILLYFYLNEVALGDSCLKKELVKYKYLASHNSERGWSSAVRGPFSYVSLLFIRV